MAISPVHRGGLRRQAARVVVMLARGGTAALLAEAAVETVVGVRWEGTAVALQQVVTAELRCREGASLEITLAELEATWVAMRRRAARVVVESVQVIG